MDTIKSYLNNMFAAFPNTAEINKAKENLLSGMEDKYNELKENGKSENEAIGIVISEFGNIDELVSELGLHKGVKHEGNPLPTITRETVNTFLSAQKSYGNLIAIGVFLCIMAPATFLIFSSLFEMRNLSSRASVFAFFPLFVLIAIAVSLFIFSGIQLEKYDYLKEPFQLDYGIKEILQHQKEAYTPTFTVHLIMGVVLCILSPLIFLLMSTGFEKFSYLETFSISLLLFFIAIAVFLFVRTGIIMDGYKMLLQEKEFSIDSKKQDKKLQTVASIFWSIITAIYLLWSFLSGDWSITWVIWPVCGILFGIITSVYKIIHSNNAQS